MNLNSLRKRIDSIDGHVLNLLNQRTEIASEIGKLKKKYGRGAYSSGRENQILRRLKKLNKGPLSNDALEKIYCEIMSYAISLSSPVKVAYLGPPATFTHLAALKKFGSQITYLACDSISDVFLEVERGDTAYGVVPIENSIEGVVTHTLDMFFDSDLKVCAQILLDVSHNLLSKVKLKDIKRIYSNPQVFGQCRLWLEQNLPAAEKIEVSSTTRAAQIAAKEKQSACIASSLASKLYKLRIVVANIEDSPHNVTRFLVIGKEYAEPTGFDRSSIMFSIKDRVGALHDMLIPFKKHGINLTKIESRPSKKKAWDYYFFVDLMGHYRDPQVKKALSELEHSCTFLKILGSYPNE